MPGVVALRKSAPIGGQESGGGATPSLRGICRGSCAGRFATQSMGAISRRISLGESRVYLTNTRGDSENWPGTTPRQAYPESSRVGAGIGCGGSGARSGLEGVKTAAWRLGTGYGMVFWQKRVRAEL